MCAEIGTVNWGGFAQGGAKLYSRVTRSVDFERLYFGIEELGLLLELLNFQVEIPTLKCSNLTIKVGFSSPLQGKTSESDNFPTT
jgi:hypothetical protein